MTVHQSNSSEKVPTEREAEHLLAERGVFVGLTGLRGLADAQEFWDAQPYCTRLYFGTGTFDYLHRDVLRAAIDALDAAAMPDVSTQAMSPQDERDCLHFDFDADSKGDSDVKVLGRSMVTAAKDYPEGTCFPCAGPIAKGERHRVERGVMDGKASTCRTCAICCAAMAAYRGDDFEAIERRYSIGRAWHESRRTAIQCATT